jgi:hypothetical protein
VVAVKNNAVKNNQVGIVFAFAVCLTTASGVDRNALHSLKQFHSAQYSPMLPSTTVKR